MTQPANQDNPIRPCCWPAIAGRSTAPSPRSAADLLVARTRESQGVRRGRQPVRSATARPPSTATSAAVPAASRPAPTASGRRALAVRHRPRRHLPARRPRRAARRRAARPCPAWRDAGPGRRAPASCLEILHRINARSHEFAQAVMHTTGQAYAMAFQAGGPHAQDRGARGGRLRLRRDDPARRRGDVGEAAGQARRRCG